MEFERFAELEKKVKELLDKYRNLKEENSKLAGEIKSFRQKTDDLEFKLLEADEKRTKAIERVDELIKLVESNAEEGAN